MRAQDKSATDETPRSGNTDLVTAGQRPPDRDPLTPGLTPVAELKALSQDPRSESLRYVAPNLERDAAWSDAAVRKAQPGNPGLEAGLHTVASAPRGGRRMALVFDGRRAVGRYGNAENAASSQPQ